MHLLSSYNIVPRSPVRDPIHTFIEIPFEFEPIIDSKLFQRLRWISQLPLEQLVYPSAQHSRFEHSLGVMHLAMEASISLINNSPEVLDHAFKLDQEFKKISDPIIQKKFFILTAGLSGLLHDIGHAPFSHTLEEACKYSAIKYKYDHEAVGYILCKKLLQDTNKINEIYSQKVLKILNKNLKELHSEISPIEKIVRKLIDGAIDVDKGDYIIRDSYHCGATYGIYDISRLWSNIIVNPKDYTIAVTHKGALEAWTLRVQRFKMYRNVYKHHTRNITDAMLIDIISSSFDHEIESENRDLMPVWVNKEELNSDANFSKFELWTDNSILKAISDSKNMVNQRIEEFLKRSLYKRGLTIGLGQYPDAVFNLKEANNKVRNDFKSLKKDLSDNKGIKIDFLFEKEEPIPVSGKDVQVDIQVKQKEDGSFSSLADFLGIEINKESEKENELSTKDHKLYIFIQESNLSSKSFIEEKVKETLKPYLQIIPKTISPLPNT
jgi:HD superfamily phosphohydrolase